MSCYSTNKIERCSGYNDVCRNHSARSDGKELYRVCPSKLSKRELEDMYFTLLENNLDLKRTINAQDDKLRCLSTKVQRLTAAQTKAKQMKDCCIGTRSVMNDQRESITELKLVNQRLAEKVQMLNMRLCSAKQFYKKPPLVRCQRCGFSNNSSSKRLLMSPKSNVTSQQGNGKVSVSCQNMIDWDNLSAKSAQTEPQEVAKGKTVVPPCDETNCPSLKPARTICDENKCRSVMEELNQKIATLQMELSEAHAEYMSRISRLEEEVRAVRRDNVKAHADRCASQHHLDSANTRSRHLLQGLRAAEAKCAELTTELTIEKRKVAELETRLKAATLSQKVNKALEEHLIAANENISKELMSARPRPPTITVFKPVRVSDSDDRKESEEMKPKAVLESIHPDEDAQEPSTAKKAEAAQQAAMARGNMEVPKSSQAAKPLDDSGYSDTTKTLEEDNLEKMNQELINRLNELQNQVKNMKSAASEQAEPLGKQSDDSSFPSDLRGRRPSADARMYKTREPLMVEDQKPPAVRTEMMDDYESKTTDTVAVAGKLESLPSKSELVFGAQGNDSREERGSKVSDRSSKSDSSSHGYPRSAFASKCWDEDDVDLNIDSLCKSCQICTIKYKCDIPTCIDADHPKCEGPRQLAVRIVKGDEHNKWQIPGPIPTDSTPDVHPRYKNLVAPDPLQLAEKDVAPSVIKIDARNSLQTGSDRRRSSIKRASLDRNRRRDSLREDIQNQPRKRTSITISEDASQNAYNSNTITEAQPQDNKLIKELPVLDYEEVAKTLQDRQFHNSKDSLETTRERLVQTQLDHTNAKYKDDQNTSMLNYYPQNEQETQAEKTERGTQHVPIPQTIGVTETLVQTRDEMARSEKTRVPKEEQATYTVTSHQPRSASPDNTDVEISSITDLPPDKIREDKTTCTHSESSRTSPSRDGDLTLSEGEVPASPPRAPPSRPADGQQKPNTALEGGAGGAGGMGGRLESALAAISEELARCKLLLTHRPEHQSIQSQTSTTVSSQPIELRRGVANQNIGDTYQPKCIFTLHIGTVVLSDEAVLMSRNKNLVLTWKFYDQNVAMSRMRTGRVLLFDFSTEYDIKINDSFLDYMKHEEMPIVISELDKQDEPFASCKLPLRDALLHTNRRADISLALLAGPQMISARAANNAAADALDAGDEVGVIDLWCMLRCDTKHLPTINRAIARHSLTMATQRRLSRHIMPQVVDDEISNDFNDIDMLQQTKMTPMAITDGETDKNIYKDVEYARTSARGWNASMFSFPTTIDIDGPPQPPSKQPAYDPNKYPVDNRRSAARRVSQFVPATSSAQELHEPEAVTLPSNEMTASNESRNDSSDIILNEVAAKIKTPGDMKHMIHRISQHEITRMPKADGHEAAEPSGSVGSLRSIMARLQKRPKYVGKNSITEGRRRSTLSNIRAISNDQRPTLDMTNRPVMTVDETNDMKIFEKYDNISKWLGTNKTDIPKKNVTILPKYVANANAIPEEEPQRDTTPRSSREEEAGESVSRLEITVLWLALNEECEAMINPHVQRVYVAYSFLGRSGAEFETPVSLPKPKHYVDKCYFNFKKAFNLQDSDLRLLGHMARCRASSKVTENHDEKDCIIFAVVSEPPEDPLGLESCEDIGYAYLYLGDILAYSTGSSAYTEVIPVQARGGRAVCGVLAVRVDGLDIVRKCLLLQPKEPVDFPAV